MKKDAATIKKLVALCAGCGKCHQICPAKIDVPKAMKIYAEYLAGDMQTLQKLNTMKSEGSPLDCIECGACSSGCPNRIDAKKQIRELAMMQSCQKLFSSEKDLQKEMKR